MKKQLILILSLIVLVAATAGILFLVNNAENEKKAEEERIEQEKVLVEMNSNDINNIEITTSDAVYKAFLNDSGKWELENKVDFEINTYYLNSLATQLSTLKATDIICPVAEADLAGYNLDNPATKIKLTTSDAETTINVGKLSTTGDFYYVTIDGRDNVYSVSKDYADYICAGKNSLKSIYILRNSDSEIRTITLEAHGKTVYSLSMNKNNEWEMKEPLKLYERVNNVGVGDVLTTIHQMIVDKFGDEHITEDQHKDYGFDKPEYIFRFTQANGETTTLLAKDYENDDTSFVELLCVETGQIFYMQSRYTYFLQEGADEFILKSACTYRINDLKALDIEWNDRENASFTIDDENNKYTMNGTSLSEESAAALDNFIKKLTALKYDTFVLESPVKSNAEPDITVTYSPSEGKKTVYTFFKSDSENYAVFIDGEYQNFTVSVKNFTAREGIYDYFDRLVDSTK